MASTVAMAGLLSSSASHALSSNPTQAAPSSTMKPLLLPPVRANLQQQQHSSPAPSSRRALLGILLVSAPAAFLAKEALADAASIKLEGAPLPSGGLPGTENADQARDVELPLKERFYLQPLPPLAAAARAKESAKDIVGVKALIDKKSWPYVQNDLRLKASYLRFDLNTVVASKSKEEKKALKLLITKLFDSINNLDYAARSKSVSKAEKYYTETVSALNDVLAKIG